MYPSAALAAPPPDASRTARWQADLEYFEQELTNKKERLAKLQASERAARRESAERRAFDALSPNTQQTRLRAERKERIRQHEEEKAAELERRRVQVM